MKKYATTGDGLLTAIMLTEEVLDSKTVLSKLAEPLTRYPQHIVSLRVTDKEGVMRSPAVLAAVREVEELIGTRGRVLLRPSGTEPVIRLLIECEEERLCAEYADRITSAVKQGGYALE